MHFIRSLFLVPVFSACLVPAATQALPDYTQLIRTLSISYSAIDEIDEYTVWANRIYNGDARVDSATINNDFCNLDELISRVKYKSRAMNELYSTGAYSEDLGFIELLEFNWPMNLEENIRRSRRNISIFGHLRKFIDESARVEREIQREIRVTERVRLQIPEHVSDWLRMVESLSSNPLLSLTGLDATLTACALTLENEVHDALLKRSSGLQDLKSRVAAGRRLVRGRMIAEIWKMIDSINQDIDDIASMVDFLEKTKKVQSEMHSLLVELESKLTELKRELANAKILRGALQLDLDRIVDAKNDISHLRSKLNEAVSRRNRIRYDMYEEEYDDGYRDCGHEDGADWKGCQSCCVEVSFAGKKFLRLFYAYKYEDQVLSKEILRIKKEISSLEGRVDLGYEVIVAAQIADYNNRIKFLEGVIPITKLRIGILQDTLDEPHDSFDPLPSVDVLDQQISVREGLLRNLEKMFEDMFEM